MKKIPDKIQQIVNNNRLIMKNLHKSSLDLLDQDLPTVWTGIAEIVSFLIAIAVVVAIALIILKIF